MSALLEDFITGVRTVVGTALPPEFIENGIWEAEHAAMIPHRPPVASGETLALPYASLVVNDFAESEDWGADNDTWEFDVTIYIVSEVPEGDSSALRAYCETLKDYVRAHDFP